MPAGIPVGAINTDRRDRRPSAGGGARIARSTRSIRSPGRSLVGPPVRLSETPGGIRTPAPLLGEHTDEVLRERLGPERATRSPRCGVPARSADRDGWPARQVTWLFLLAYACSGLAGLVYEVSWTRLLTLYMGHTTAAASTVVAAFMGGLAGGAALGGRIAVAPDAAPVSLRLRRARGDRRRWPRCCCRSSWLRQLPSSRWAYADGAPGCSFRRCGLHCVCCCCSFRRSRLARRSRSRCAGSSARTRTWDGPAATLYAREHRWRGGRRARSPASC